MGADRDDLAPGPAVIGRFLHDHIDVAGHERATAGPPPVPPAGSYPPAAPPPPPYKGAPRRGPKHTPPAPDFRGGPRSSPPMASVPITRARGPVQIDRICRSSLSKPMMRPTEQYN